MPPEITDAAPAEDAAMVPFALDASARYEADGYAVYPNSLLFRAGEFPAINFSITPAELSALAADRTPIHANIEHKTFLKGRAGEIVEKWTEEGGAVLRGRVRIPLGLDRLLTDEERKPSLEIARATKKAIGFALTTKPRVTDAVLMSLDSDDTALFDSAPTPTNDNAAQPAPGGGNAMPDPTRPTTLLSRLVALFSKAGIPEAEAQAELELVDFSAPVDPQVEELQKRVALMSATNRQMEAERWADTMIAVEHRAVPAERSAMVAAFARAAEDDDASPAVVTFSTGAEEVKGSRLDALKALFANRPAHNLMEELVQDIRDGKVEAAALFNVATTAEAGKNKPMTAERKAELLSKTAAGRAALKAKSA